MEEIINEIANETLQELEKAGKSPYPLYYKNVFVSLVKQKKLYDQLNEKLLCENSNVNEDLLNITKNTVETVSNVSKEIKEDSENLIEEVTPLQIDSIKETIIKFSSGLINKVNKLEETVNSLQAELDKAYEELFVDPLTRVYNRKALNENLNELLEIGKDKELDLVIVAVDVDHFKKINDSYGHLVGDFVLIKIVSIIKKMIRREHEIYRYRGDEFIIIFNRMTIDKVKSIIKRVLNKIDSTLLKYKDEIIKVTISVGITQHKKGDTFESIINRSYEALYNAKKTRNAFSIKE